MIFCFLLFQRIISNKFTKQGSSNKRKEKQRYGDIQEIEKLRYMEREREKERDFDIYIERDRETPIEKERESQRVYITR